MLRPTQGLKQKRENGVFDARRAVPHDVRHAFGGRREFVKSLETTDLRLAMRKRDELWARWDAEIAEVRRSGVATPDLLSLVLEAIERWRRRRCDAAHGVEFEAGFTSSRAAWELPIFQRQRADEGIASDPLYAALLTSPPRVRRTTPSIGEGAVRHAEFYFEKHPDASRELQMPFSVGILLGRLQVAERDPEAWREIDGFDDQLRAAIAEVKVALKLTPALLEATRHPFAKAWLEVVRHEEAARRRAASFLAAIEAARLDAASVHVAAAPRGYAPREDDHTISELIASYRSDRDGSFGAESTSRKYNHIFAALKEALGADKPIRAITSADCRKVRDLLRKLPVHMGKRYPGKTMAEAIEAAAEEDEPQFLAPNTINSYLSNFVAMFHWAIQQQWADFNPATGLVDKNMPLLERRAFEHEEATRLFWGLEAEKAKTAWKYWVPALGLFTGCRLNEICQLEKEDVCEFEGVPYLRITVFASDGRRRSDSRLKTETSKRNIPLHPQLVAAGFLDYAAAAPRGRLFPELLPGPSGGYSHYASTWFGEYLDRVGLSDPSLVFHSFRHGFKEACQAIEMPDSIWRAMGGWAAKDVAEKYGRRDMVPTLHNALKKVRFGGFVLAEREGCNSSDVTVGQ